MPYALRYHGECFYPVLKVVNRTLSHMYIVKRFCGPSPNLEEEEKVEFEDAEMSTPKRSTPRMSSPKMSTPNLTLDILGVDILGVDISALPQLSTRVTKCSWSLYE